MDKFDKAIIQALKINARQSISKIAEQVNLSRTSVSARIKALEKSNVIRGYQVMLSESQKSSVSVYFEIKNAPKFCYEIIDLIHAIPEVITCHSITGEADLLVYIKAESMQRIHQIREDIDSHSAILKMTTHVVMSEWINNNATS